MYINQEEVLEFITCKSFLWKKHFSFFQQLIMTKSVFSAIDENFFATWK